MPPSTSPSEESLSPVPSEGGGGGREGGGGGRGEGAAMWVSGQEGGGLAWEEVARLLLTDPSLGLPSRDVLARRQAVGFNEFLETQDDPLWKKYLGQVGGWAGLGWWVGGLG